MMKMMIIMVEASWTICLAESLTVVVVFVLVATPIIVVWRGELKVAPVHRIHMVYNGEIFSLCYIVSFAIPADAFFVQVG